MRSELVSALRGAGIDFTLLGGDGGWVIVAPALGARILGAGVGEENALWSAPVLSRRSWAEGGNVGGQRTWIAPEGGPHGFFYTDDPSSWRVPEELDPADFAALPAVDGWARWQTTFTARCLDGESFPIAIKRSVRISTGPALTGTTGVLRIDFRHSLENRGSAPLDRRVGLWCIAQCPCEERGTIVIPLSSGHGADSVHPYFEPLPDGVLRTEGGAALLTTRPGVKYKVGCGAEAAAGAIAFVGARGEKCFLVHLRFSVDRAGTYVDRPFFGGPVENGDPVQAYNDPGVGAMAFCELEAHAPAVRLRPGEVQEFEIQMTVAFGSRGAIGGLMRREIAPSVSDSDVFSD